MSKKLLISGAGIYQIRNLKNNKIYIGSASKLNERKQSHFFNLNHNKHHNTHLQSAYNLYGKENFVFEVLIYAERDLNYLLYLEEKTIAVFDATNPEKGYNIKKIPSSSLGIKASSETKLKLSISHMGFEPSEETKLKLSELTTGSNNPSAKLIESDVIEIKKLISENKISYSEIAKLYNISISRISAIANGDTWKSVDFEIIRSEPRRIFAGSKKGYKHSEEAKLNMSKSKTGSKHPAAILNESSVLEIKIMLLKGIGLKEIASIYGVNPSTINSIKINQSWRHVQWPINI